MLLANYIIATMARRFFLLMNRHIVVVLLLVISLYVSYSLYAKAEEPVPEPQCCDTAHPSHRILKDNNQHKSIQTGTADTTLYHLRQDGSTTQDDVVGLIINDPQQENNGGVSKEEALKDLSEEEMDLYFEEDELLELVTLEEQAIKDIPNVDNDSAKTAEEFSNDCNATPEPVPGDSVNDLVIYDPRDVETVPMPRTIIETRIDDEGIKTSRATLLGALAQSFVRTTVKASARLNEQEALVDSTSCNYKMFEYCHRPPCGFWGDPNRDVRMADPTVLERIIQDMQKLEETDQESGNTTALPVEPEELPTALEGGQEIPNEQTTEAKRRADDLVEGCDDLDKLFEGVTTPDEFDVASNGSSIQEVIMGSATRVLLKRISVAARIAKTKTIQVVRTLVRQVRRGSIDEYSTAEEERNENEIQHESRPFQFLRDSQGNIAPLRHLRNEHGELAPLQSLRNVHGEFAPLQSFRNGDGNFLFPSKEALWNGLKAYSRILLQVIRKIEAMIDPIFERSPINDVDDTLLIRPIASKKDNTE